MKKIGFIVLVSIFSAYLAGCGKKEPSSEQLMQQEPMSMETLTAMATEPQAQPVVLTQAQEADMPLESLPPAGPYKPTVNQIQTALQNAGYYTSKIDGITGPKTKQAIKDFQQANNLEADAKVGPKTWSLLSKYLVEREQ